MLPLLRTRVAYGEERGGAVPTTSVQACCREGGAEARVQKGSGKQEGRAWPQGARLLLQLSPYTTAAQAAGAEAEAQLVLE